MGELGWRSAILSWYTRETASLRNVARETVGGVQLVYPRERAWAKVAAVGDVGEVTSKTVGGARVRRW